MVRVHTPSLSVEMIIPSQPFACLIDMMSLISSVVQKARSSAAAGERVESPCLRDYRLIFIALYALVLIVVWIVRLI
jgi:hypothetical protein